MDEVTEAVLASGGPYTNSSVVREIPDIDVDGTGCYAFYIYDSYGDGICCSNGNGYFRVYYDDVLIKSGGNFGAMDVAAGMGTGCPENEIQLSELTINPYGSTGESMYVTGVVKSNGAAPLTSFDVTYKIDGGEYVTNFTQACNIAMLETTSFAHTLPFDFDEGGRYTVTVKISNPNGQADDEDDNILTHQLIVNENSVERIVLLEYFSTESCGNCPPATNNINSWMSTRPNVVRVVHHAGYYTDKYTIPASTALLPFYNAGGGTYAPASMLDRAYLSPDNDPGPIFFPSANYTPGLMDQRLAAPAYVTVGMDGVYDADSRELTLTISGELVGDLHEEDLRLTLYLLEDDLKSTTQSGYNGTYTHNSVIRAALSANFGDEGLFNGNVTGTTYTKEYAYTVPAAWEADNMKVVAFVNNWDPSNVNNRIVLNTNHKQLSDFISQGNDIETFSFGSISMDEAEINTTAGTIDIEVVAGTDVTSLIAEFTLSAGATAKIDGIEQVSGVTANDFTNPVVYTVASAGGTEKTWTVTVSVEDVGGVAGNKEASVNIYPNPAKDMFTIKNAEGAQIQIYSVTGQAVKTIVNAGRSETIDASLLPAGTYMVKVTTENSSVVKKVIINK